MLINLPFEIGNKVFIIKEQHKEIKVPCEHCKGKASVKVNGVKFYCPDCDDGYDYDSKPICPIIMKNAEIEEIKFYRLRHSEIPTITYSCNIPDYGRAEFYDNSLFKSIEDAQIEVTKICKKLKLKPPKFKNI